MPIIRESELDIVSYNAEQTQAIGARLGMLLQKGDIVCLIGDMGAGKTMFTSGLGRGWGATTPITSPTFNLVHQHRRTRDRSVLYHLDCYRLRGVQDTDSIGLDDMLDGQGVVVLEWAERVESALPGEYLWIEIRVREELRRTLLMEAVGSRYQTRLDEFRASFTRN